MSNLKSVLARQLGALAGHDGPGGADGSGAERQARLSASIAQIEAQIARTESEIAASSRSLKVMGLPPVAA